MNYLWYASNLVMNRLFIEFNILNLVIGGINESNKIKNLMTEQYSMIVIRHNRYCRFQISMEYCISICNYETMWKIAALLRDANQVDKSLLSNVTVFSSNFAFVYISNVILISLSRQENLSKEMNESNNQLVLDEFV